MPLSPALVPTTLPVVVQLGRVPAARPWLAELPSLIRQVRDAYGLRLGAPLHGGSCSWVAPAELPDRTPVILKIGWPHQEMYGEPIALRGWNGHGAVRLLAHDPQRHALLLERCDPGHPLTTAPGTATARLRAGLAVLRLLWAVPPPDGIDPLGPVTRRWADLADERMARLRPGYDPGLVAEGVRLLRDLPATSSRDVILHGDFNPGNVLSHTADPVHPAGPPVPHPAGPSVRHSAGVARPAGPSPAGPVPRWVAIDPKPMVGDPAYDPWPLLAQLDDPFGHGDPARVLRSRVAQAADELSLDPVRIVRWAVARRVESALWLAEHGDVAAGAAAMREVRILAEL